MTIKQINDLVSKAKLEQALKAAAELAQAQGDDDTAQTILLLQGRYTANERENRIGLKTPADYSRERNSITYSLLETLNDLDDAPVVPPVQPDPIPPTPPPGPQPPAAHGVTTIVFLAASPADLAQLKLNEEHSMIVTQLQDSPQHASFRLLKKLAVTPSEFSKYLFLEKPEIVHFSGHGDLKKPEVQDFFRSAGRDNITPREGAAPTSEPGIFLLSEDKRQSQFVTATFLSRTFKAMVKNHHVPIKAIVFNACHSEAQAKAVSLAAPDAYVIGTDAAVRDVAAAAFARGFYFGLVNHMSIEDAVYQGITDATVYGETEDRFTLYRNGQKIELS